jgi:hypothetical protein
MISSEVQRTLVKSPPELWSELSDPDALARHLGELGEIKITRTEPEKLVEWEAVEGTTGTVAIKASGWGTKVTLTVQHEPATPEPAELEDAQRSDDPGPSAEAEPDARQEPADDEPAAIAPQLPAESGPSATADPTPGTAEAVSPEAKLAPVTEAARRAADWPAARADTGPAIESDLRAAEAEAAATPVSEHSPWHLAEDENAPQAESVGEPSPETEPAPAEPRRGFFARLFGSRRKRPAAAVVEELTGLAAEPPGLPAAQHAQAADESTEDRRETGAAPDLVAETSGPEAPVETIEPEPVALAEPEDRTTADAEAESTEPEATSDPEPVATAESDGLAAELKAAEEIAAEQVKAVLTSVLDRLGAAHHRPFSRA